MSDKSEDYELCMRAESVHLPKEGFFGVTAATGGLAGITLNLLFSSIFYVVADLVICNNTIMNIFKLNTNKVKLIAFYANKISNLQSYLKISMTNEAIKFNMILCFSFR